MILERGEPTSQRYGQMDTTLLKGLTVLEAVARSDKPRGVTELAAQLKLGKSNVFRVLQTLASAGYLRRDPTGKLYECSLKVWELGSLTIARLDPLAVAHPVITQMNLETLELAYFAIVDRGEVLFVDIVQSQHTLRAHSRIGERAPIYAVAPGKVYLAFADETVIAQALRSLSRHTRQTVTDASAFRRELLMARRLGYAVNRGEWREGVSGIAAPVFDRLGQPIGAVGITGPSDRLNTLVLRGFAPIVVAAAADISTALGYGGANSRGAAPGG